MLLYKDDLLTKSISFFDKCKTEDILTLPPTQSNEFNYILIITFMFLSAKLPNWKLFSP